MHKPITRCRICGNDRLEPVLDLGEQMLTGVFPKTRNAEVTRGPLRLVKCLGEGACGLLQLAHSYDLGAMYGDNYGYRSGLNPSMVAHLTAKVRRIADLVTLRRGDLVIDIGSNDGTTLGAYAQEGLDRLGVDPTGAKFRQYYPAGVELIPDFFSADLVRQSRGNARAKVVTSFSMFYDLEAPTAFMREVHDILADDGVWVFEQSYMPSMLATNSYDTVCHEHLEFYALTQVIWMADRVGFEIVDVEFNDVNGGSFSVTARKSRSGGRAPAIQQILDREAAAGLSTLAPYHAFAERAAASREALTAFVRRARAGGKVVGALGASTKGNVLLQYCGFTDADICAVGEVNPDKFGSYTPGTYIPIIPEPELLARNPDYLIVLPWHFRDFFLAGPAFAGRELVFPLPELSIRRTG
jgi:NDP-4-keto-2,6-dideoxyhexose 3-C-methyltransferase